MTKPPHICLTSQTFPAAQWQQMADAGLLAVHEGHFQYPADPQGMHVTRFFSVEPLAAHAQCVAWIAADIARWVEREHIAADAVFAPAQAGVTTIAQAIAEALRVQPVFWKYLPTGRFGEPTGDAAVDFIRGRITPGMRVIVFNGVTQQGRCVGRRLQDFAKGYGATIAGLAVVAKGTTGGVSAVEKEWEKLFYATMQVDLPVYAPAECPLEGKPGGPPLIPWTALRTGR